MDLSYQYGLPSVENWAAERQICTNSSLSDLMEGVAAVGTEPIYVYLTCFNKRSKNNYGCHRSHSSADEMLCNRPRRTLKLIFFGFILVIFSYSFLQDSFLSALSRRERSGTCILCPTDSRSQPLRPSALGKHRYRQDGLLEVNEDGVHPIFELISHSEAAWEAKLRAASKSLPAAVREYRRRYHRDPPKGFDLWYAFIRSSNRHTNS